MKYINLPSLGIGIAVSIFFHIVFVPTETPEQKRDRMMIELEYALPMLQAMKGCNP